MLNHPELGVQFRIAVLGLYALVTTFGQQSPDLDIIPEMHAQDLISQGEL
jgi:hypothetical protein